MMNSQMNPKKINQAKNLELDKELIKEIYALKEKQKPTYKVMLKKTIYDKESNCNNSNSNTNQSSSQTQYEYYSNYKYFRNYLLTSYTTDYANTELKQINALLQFSSSIRKDLNDKHNLNIFKDNKEERKDAFSNVIVDALLKLKPTVDNSNANTTNFSLYSEFIRESDQFSISQYENFIYVKFYNQNRKLTNSLQIESSFTNCVKDFSVSKIKEMKPLFINSIPDEKRNYINIQSLYYGRDIDFFKSIDTFMSYYKEDDFLKIKERENELFEGIYEILSKCNCVSFLSYLYSKSTLFKFIYDIFTKKKENMFERLNMPGIEKEKVTEPFLNESLRDWFKEPSADLPLPILNKKKVEPRMSIPQLKHQSSCLEEYNDIFGCLLFERIGLIEQRVSFNDIVTLINTSQKSSKDVSPLNRRRSTMQYQFDTACMLINKNSALKIFKNELSEVNNPIVFELFDDIDVIKVDYRRLGEDWIDKVKNEDMYFISLNLEGDIEDKKYYVIKMPNDVSILFEELAKDRIKSFDKEFEERHNTNPNNKQKDESNSDHLSAVNSALLNSLLNK